MNYPFGIGKHAIVTGAAVPMLTAGIAGASPGLPSAEQAALQAFSGPRQSIEQIRPSLENRVKEVAYTQTSTPLYAQAPQTSSDTQTQPQASIDTIFNNYETVDKILKGLPFIPVNQKNFAKEVEKGNVVLFFYNNHRDPQGISRRLALIFKAVLDDTKEKENYKGIKFLAYDRDSEISNPIEFYLHQFGFTGTPYIAFYQNGKKIFFIDGGPKPNFADQWVPWLRTQIKDKFRDKQV